jgi:general secretion pathway protein F
MEDGSLATFHYRAYTEQGVVTAGTIVADGVEAAIDALYGAGLTPFETYGVSGTEAKRSYAAPSAGGKAPVPFWKRELSGSNRFSLKELTAFTVELASLTNSGLPLDEAFRVIAASGAASKTSRLAHALLKDVLGGSQLSEAMARRPEIFPAEYRAILGAGEAGGAIAAALKQISELLARRLELRGKISAALVYPIVLILMSLASVAVIVFVLVPSLSPVFTDAGLPLPGILSTFADLQDNWIAAMVVLCLGGVAGAVGWRIVKNSPGMRLELDRMTCSTPVIARLIQIREAAGFARALGTLLCARAPLMSAMQTARTLVSNRHLAARYANAIDRVPEGTPLHRALEGTGLMPASALRLVAVGEETGQLGSMLVQVATVLEGDLQLQIERMVGLLTPFLTLAIGGGVGALIMQVMSAVLSINDLAFQ